MPLGRQNDFSCLREGEHILLPLMQFVVAGGFRYHEPNLAMELLELTTRGIVSAYARAEFAPLSLGYADIMG